MKDGLCPAAKAVTSLPLLLTKDGDSLHCKWDALTLPTAPGGMGVAFSTEQARKAVGKHPQLLNFSLETFKTGWTMLIAADNGLGLPPEEARKCLLRQPRILPHDHAHVLRRITVLESLGYAEARTMVFAHPPVLSYKEETVMEHAAWW